MSLHRTTLAFLAQRTHQDLRHIARSITYHCTTVAYWRFRTCVLSYGHLFHANIHKTDCKFLHSNDILVASDRATIVKGPLMTPEVRFREEKLESLKTMLDLLEAFPHPEMMNKESFPYLNSLTLSVNDSTFSCFITVHGFLKH